MGGYSGTFIVDTDNFVTNLDTVDNLANLAEIVANLDYYDFLIDHLCNYIKIQDIKWILSVV